MLYESWGPRWETTWLMGEAGAVVGLKLGYRALNASTRLPVDIEIANGFSSLFRWPRDHERQECALERQVFVPARNSKITIAES